MVLPDTRCCIRSRPPGLNSHADCLRVQFKGLPAGELYSLLDIAVHAANVYCQEKHCSGKIGLTTISVGHRMHNTGQDGQDAHFGYGKPARVIYWLAAGDASVMKEAEWYVTTFLRARGCSLRNSFDARTGGAGVRDGDHLCHLYLVGDSYNGKGCHCNYCEQFTREMHEAWKSSSDDEADDLQPTEVDDCATTEADDLQPPATADDGADDLMPGKKLRFV